MKKLHIILLLSVIAILPFVLAACNKLVPDDPEPQLPPITYEGKNTFGCKINGEILAVDKFGNGLKCEYYYRSFEPELYGTFVLRGSSKIKDKQFAIGFHYYNGVFDTGVYDMTLKYEGSNLKKRVFVANDENDYYCYENMYGKINIQHIDTINHFASGTFEFDAVNKDNNKDTVRVRDGRFDAKYIY